MENYNLLLENFRLLFLILADLADYNKDRNYVSPVLNLKWNILKIQFPSWQYFLIFHEAEITGSYWVNLIRKRANQEQQPGHDSSAYAQTVSDQRAFRNTMVRAGLQMLYSFSNKQFHACPTLHIYYQSIGFF